jgi:type I restriction enzyme, S subunit
MSGLPREWTMSTVGQVGEVSLGRQRRPRYHQGEGMRPYLRVANVFEDRIDTTDVMQMTFSDEEFERYRLRPGDVLLNEGQSPHLLGRPAIYRGQPPDVAFTNTLIRFRPRSMVTPEWALAVFRHHMRSRRFMRESRITTNIAHLSAKRFSTVEFPVPPLAEQRRIVALLEEQFSRLDVGAAALRRARRNLRRMRVAVVESAVSDASECAGHLLTQVGKLLSQPLANGRSVPNGQNHGFPVLRLTAVREGRIDVKSAKPGAWTAAEAKQYLIAKGDYLVVRGNGSMRLVGRGGLVAADANVAYPDTLIRVRFDQSLVLPEYAALLWESPTVRRQIEARARTSAGIYKINQLDIENLTLPVPSIRDQYRVLKQAETSLTNIIAVEKTLGLADLHVEALRSSILAAAFSGNLVCRNQGVEPALSLIERVATDWLLPNGHRHHNPSRGVTA